MNVKLGKMISKVEEVSNVEYTKRYSSMLNMATKFKVVFILVLLLLLGVYTTTCKTVNAADAFNGGSQKIAELVNEERGKRGIKPVKFFAYAPIQKAARIRAGEILNDFHTHGLMGVTGTLC